MYSLYFSWFPSSHSARPLTTADSINAILLSNNSGALTLKQLAFRIPVSDIAKQQLEQLFGPHCLYSVKSWCMKCLNHLRFNFRVPLKSSTMIWLARESSKRCVILLNLLNFGFQMTYKSCFFSILAYGAVKKHFLRLKIDERKKQ